MMELGFSFVALRVGKHDVGSVFAELAFQVAVQARGSKFDLVASFGLCGSMNSLSICV
jgi:hypothetical protein